MSSRRPPQKEATQPRRRRLSHLTGVNERTDFWRKVRDNYHKAINEDPGPLLLDIHFPIKFDLRASGYPPEKQLNPTGKMLLQEPNLKSATATLTEKWKQRWILIKWPSGANIQSKIYRVYTPAETEENTWWIRAVRPNGSFFPLVINKARMNDTIVNNHRVQFIFTVLGSGMAPRANRDPTEQHHIQG